MQGLTPKSFVTVLCLVVLYHFSASAVPFDPAPNNGVTDHGPETPGAQKILKAYLNKKGSMFRAEQLAVLEPSDFVDMENLSATSLKTAAQIIFDKKLIAVESTVGNAERLGNPHGGKGAVVLGSEITFLDAKIIRWAIESEIYGVGIPLVVWTSEENKVRVSELLKSMEQRMLNNGYLSSQIKMALRNYLRGKNITLMAHSIRYPVINKQNELTTRRYRNLGAGELVPVLYASGVAEKLNISVDSFILFSNIDFDPRVTKVLAAFVEARSKAPANRKPNLMQVHVATSAPGGSAYMVTLDDGSKVIMPIEGVGLPAGAPQAKTTNSNTVVLTGAALMAASYEDLPIAFEIKGTPEDPDILTKVSLADVAFNPEVVTAVALGDAGKDFFNGFKKHRSFE